MPWQTLLLWSLILATNVFGDGLANQRGKTLNGKHLRLVYIEVENFYRRDGATSRLGSIFYFV